MPEGHIPEQQLQQLFTSMVAAAEDDKEEEVLRLYQQARQLGWEFSIEAGETTHWEEDDGMKYATVLQDSRLLLGAAVVAQWQETYGGEYGCMGTSWWTMKVDDSGLDDGVDALLNLLDIDRPSPHVPEPVEA